MITHSNRPRSLLLFGFTLTELLISISIFAIVSVIVTDLYIQSFRQTARANMQNQFYEDARYILTLISGEIQNGMIDYDEYYNQRVILKALNEGISVPGASAIRNYGQNFGKYYSSFFHPGDDEKLGFDCNDSTPGAPHRNSKKCTPLRRTIDRNTGQNPFDGKYDEGAGAQPGISENAFCGVVSYKTDGAVTKPNCPADALYSQNELYLISADGFEKTILAREKIGETAGTPPEPIYTFSGLRLKGTDTDGDGIADKFVCALKFTCLAEGGTLPRLNTVDPDGNPVLGDLDDGSNSVQDPASDNFSKDFIPMIPLTVNIKELSFFISPLESPDYAFAEASENQEQPLVTIKLTVEQNPATAGAKLFDPITLIRTVGAGVRSPIPSPLRVQ